MDRRQGVLRAAAYCRVSTDKEDQRNSLEAQRRFFEGYLQDRPGWTLRGIFADEGLSGTSVVHRPQFAALLALARAGELDVILTKEVSRFARNTVDTLRITRELKAQGVGVLFLNDGIDTREEDGEFRLTIMASVAQEESRKISQRTRWGQAQAMKRGVVFGNDSLYGYTLRGGKLTVRPEQAAVVRRMFRSCLEEGKGTHVIARELNQAGVTPPQGGAGGWSSASVLRILRNEKYTGDLLQQKYRTVDHLTHRKVPNDGTEPQLLLRDHHEAIVDRATFQGVQRELDRRRTMEEEGRRFSSRYWYSGKVRCGLCGKGFTVKTTRRGPDQVYRRLVCRGSLSGGGCPMSGINAQWVELAARWVLARLPLSEERIRAGVLEELPAAPAEGEDLEGAIGRLDARRARALEAYLEGLLSKEEWKVQQSRWEKERATLEGRMALRARERGLSQEKRFQQVEEVVARELAGGTWVLEEVIETIAVEGKDLTVTVKDWPVCYRVTMDSRGSGRSYEAFVAGCSPLPCKREKGTNTPCR